MIYRAELKFVQNLLKKFRLQTLVLEPDEPLPKKFNFGLRSFFGWDSGYEGIFFAIMSRADERVIYKVSDGVHCRYAFFKLPETGGEMLVIGPYFTEETTEKELAETAEQFSLSEERFQQMKHLLAEVPVIAEEHSFTVVLQVLGETIWGGEDRFQIVDIDREFADAPMSLGGGESAESGDQLMLNMQLMETRYAYENELMRIVSHGMTQKADHMGAMFSRMSFEQRSGNPLHSLKHYCIVCNTLLRKAAEQGGVHPLYLDRTSSDFAWKIDTLRAEGEGEKLMNEMIRTYTRLVRKHATASYSGLVQKSIAYIDTDLAGDLSLHTVAAAQKVTPSHLSTQFKKETGQTLTDYVNEKRVRLALHLLMSTRLQVQAVAQQCGFQDPNYFVRLFKKRTGVTPSAYRKGSAADFTENQK